MLAPLRSVSRGRVLPRGCRSLVATACAMHDVPCQPDARQVRVVRGHQRAAAVRARPDFEPHAACRATATVAKPRLPTSRRSYFLRVSVNRNYSGKLVHEETFRVQAPPAATLATAALVPRPPTSLPLQVVNEAPENNPPIKMEARESA